MARCRHAALALTLLTLAPSSLTGQTGLELGGVPALNFDADEGVGYGVVVELYEYGNVAIGPYLWTLQPTVFLTTEGRKDFTLFFDAPHLPGAWRLDAFVGSEARFATPYCGVGNASVFDEGRVTEADPYYHRFGRTRRSAAVNVQHGLGAGPLRVLLGGGVVKGSSVPVPDGVGTTLLE